MSGFLFPPSLLRTAGSLALGLLLCAANAAETAPASAGQDVKAPPQNGFTLAVDGRDLPRGLLRAREVLPAQPGEMVLVYPKWIPGTHAPAGRVDNIGGLRFLAADGRSDGESVLGWRRDDADAFRFIVSVPEGTRRVAVELAYIANQPDSNSVGCDISGGAGLGIINWNCCLLYPEGRAAAAIPVDCSLTLPDGWRIGTSLSLEPVQDPAPDPRPGSSFSFARTSLRDLIDQPLIAGPGIVSVPLAIASGPPVTMHIGCEDGGPLAAGQVDPAWAAGLAKVVDQALLLFGRAHYRGYHFLLVAGNSVQGIGLEHSSCSVSGVRMDDVGDFAATNFWDRNVAPHEFVHSWCGKHVRPAGMIAADYQQPLRTAELWVYEGLDQYLGEVLAVRAGMIQPEEFRDQLAMALDDLGQHGGRDWRSLEDTARAGWQLRAPSPHFQNLRRGQDYYLEGMVFWLEADLLIRSGSGGKKSLDDFCAAFFGAPVETGASRGYGIDELVAALEAVHPYDWRAMIRSRIQQVRPEFDHSFLALGGWKFTYAPEPNAITRAREERGRIDARSSLGCAFSGNRVRNVMPGSPAALAGLDEDAVVSSIDDGAFSAESLRQALVKAALPDGDGTIAIAVRDGRVLKIACAVGPRYPSLERDGDHGNLLAAILAPR